MKPALRLPYRRAVPAKCKTEGVLYFLTIIFLCPVFLCSGFSSGLCSFPKSFSPISSLQIFWSTAWPCEVYSASLNSSATVSDLHFYFWRSGENFQIPPQFFRSSLSYHIYNQTFVSEYLSFLWHTGSVLYMEKSLQGIYFLFIKWNKTIIWENDLTYLYRFIHLTGVIKDQICIVFFSLCNIFDKVGFLLISLFK